MDHEFPKTPLVLCHPEFYEGSKHPEHSEGAPSLRSGCLDLSQAQDDNLVLSS